MRSLAALFAAPAALIVIGGLAGAAAAADRGDQVETKTGKQHIQEAKDANDCRPLEEKFDAAYASRKSQPGAEEAKRLRDLGAERCTDGDYDQGINNLYSALDQLGVKH